MNQEFNTIHDFEGSIFYLINCTAVNYKVLQYFKVSWM